MATVVKLVQIGKAVREYEVSDNPTVGGLLEKAGITYTPNSVTINQDVVDQDTNLDDGDTVYIGDKMKGNLPFTVKMIRLGHADPVMEVAAESGVTIKSLIDSLPSTERAKFYKEDGSEYYSYNLNGNPVDSSSTVIPTPTDAAVPARLIMSVRQKGNAAKAKASKSKKVVAKTTKAKKAATCRA